MVNLLDIMRTAQSGAGFDNIARQFGLSPEQTHRAVEALLPAFTLAFQQSLRNPAAFAHLLETMTSGRYVPFYEGGSASPFRSGSPGSEFAIQQLFGSDEVSRRVASQASAVTGVATGVLHGMLPTVAAMIMGGMSRAVSVEGLSDTLVAWANWLRALKPGEPPRQPSAPAPFDPYRVWSDAVAAMMGSPRPPAAPPAPTDPWSAMLAAMMPGMAPPPPPPKPPAAQPDPFALLGQMFQAGRDVQDQYVASLRAIFDGVWARKG